MIWMVPDAAGRPSFFLLTADAGDEVRDRMAAAGGRPMGRIVLAPVPPAASTGSGIPGPSAAPVARD